MPTYSYTCDACGKSFEKEQRIIEDPIKDCELCGKPKARRQIISGNFILKGGGWYSDLYSSSKPASSSSSSGASSSTTSTSKDGSTGTSKDTSSGSSKDGSTGTSKDTSSGSGSKATAKAVAAE